MPSAAQTNAKTRAIQGRRPRPRPGATPRSAAAPASAIVPVIAESAPHDEHDARAVDFENIASTRMFEKLGGIRTLAHRPEGHSVARDRYSREELYAIAEIAYHYQRCGGFRLAAVIFEGLTMIAPNEAYFALALGLASERLGDRGKAQQCYAKARELDPTEPYADINLAELALEAGDRRTAVALLRSGIHKCNARKNVALERKATAMLMLLGAR
jgi:predicted Zn-dependent protease